MRRAAGYLGLFPVIMTKIYFLNVCRSIKTQKIHQKILLDFKAIQSKAIFTRKPGGRKPAQWDKSPSAHSL